MISRELGPTDRANMLLYLGRKRADLGLKVMLYNPKEFGRAQKGAKSLAISGHASLQHVGELLRPYAGGDARPFVQVDVSSRRGLTKTLGDNAIRSILT